MNEKYSYICIYDHLLHLNLTKDTQVMIPILLRNIEDVLQASALTMRGLRRFVREHRDYIDSQKGLNPKASYKKGIFLFYMLYIVGKNEEINSLLDLNTFLKQNFGEGEIQVTEESASRLLTEMLKDNTYIEKIKFGADKIEEWPM